MSILKRIYAQRTCWLLSFISCLLILMPSPLRAAPQGPFTSELSPVQLQQLVAPIALYPDALDAQVLAAAEYPDQITEAEDFLESHPGMTGEALAAEVNLQDWDPSVKALTQTPTVLENMARNLAWTSELGAAYTNQPDQVMDAIQYLRKQAIKAGTLKSNSQLKVKHEGETIVVEPANPDVVYVPVYDPSVVFGYPVGLWPGFVPWWAPGAGISFSIGFAIGPFFRFGWGWPVWGFDWHRHVVLFARAPYVVGHPVFYRPGLVFHGPLYARGGPFVRGYRVAPLRPIARPFAVRPGFEARAFAARGRASFRRG
jgi:hypothetical protein